MAKAKKPTWFKLYESYDNVIDAIPSADVGDGLKAAMYLFKTGESPKNTLSPFASIVFHVLKQSIDEANEDYRMAVETGRKGARIRNERRIHADNMYNYTPVDIDNDRLPW